MKLQEIKNELKYIRVYLFLLWVICCTIYVTVITYSIMSYIIIIRISKIKIKTNKIHNTINLENNIYKLSLLLRNIKTI